MPDSFQLVMPEPDPDEEPLEVDGQEKLPVKPVETQVPSKPRFFTSERSEANLSHDIRQPENDLLPADQSLLRDPDEVWQESVDRDSRDDLRFSLAEMFFVTALLAGILTVGRFVRLPLLAGFLGLMVMVGLGIISNPQRSRFAYVVWVALITAYIFIAIGAAWTAGK